MFVEMLNVQRCLTEIHFSLLNIIIKGTTRVLLLVGSSSFVARLSIINANAFFL